MGKIRKHYTNAISFFHFSNLLVFSWPRHLSKCWSFIFMLIHKSFLLDVCRKGQTSFKYKTGQFSIFNLATIFLLFFWPLKIPFKFYLKVFLWYLKFQYIKETIQALPYNDKKWIYDSKSLKQCILMAYQIKNRWKTTNCYFGRSLLT